MTTSLRRYARLVREGELNRLREESTFLESELVGIDVDFAKVREVFKMVRAKYPSPSKEERAELDRELVEPLHRAMSDLSRRDASDMRLWHWLCIAELPDVVSWRWYGSENVPAEELARQSLSRHFLGKNTLQGISRNALARLWWCAEALYSESDGYLLACEALERQDLFVGIFERDFGLYPPAARACVRQFRGASAREWRTGTVRLNHYLTTIVLETLTEEDVVELLSE